MDDELITALIAAIEAARTDGEGQILADHLKARINAAGIYVGRISDWD
jgi:hypothetical protein